MYWSLRCDNDEGHPRSSFRSSARAWSAPDGVGSAQSHQTECPAWRRSRHSCVHSAAEKTGRACDNSAVIGQSVARTRPVVAQFLFMKGTGPEAVCRSESARSWLFVFGIGKVQIEEVSSGAYGADARGQRGYSTVRLRGDRCSAAGGSSRLVRCARRTNMQRASRYSVPGNSSIIRRTWPWH